MSCRQLSSRGDVCACCVQIEAQVNTIVDAAQSLAPGADPDLSVQLTKQAPAHP